MQQVLNSTRGQAERKTMVKIIYFVIKIYGYHQDMRLNRMEEDVQDRGEVVQSDPTDYMLRIWPAKLSKDSI